MSRRRLQRVCALAELRATGSDAEKRQRRSMGAAIAGNQNAAVGAEIERRSVPVGGDAARPFDDRNHRAKIVWLQAGFKNEVNKPGGDQAVGIAIRAKARQLDRGGKPGE